MDNILSTPLFLSWEVTNRCNLRCKVCYNASADKLVDEIETSEVTEITEKIAACRPLFINLGGGEPLLRSDIEDIVRKIIEKGVDVQIVTNGTVYNEKLLIMLKRLGVMSIQVSIDGFEDEHDTIRGKGTFRKSIKTLKFLIGHGCPAVAAVVMTKLNYHSLPDLTEYLHRLGVKKMGVFRFIPAGRGKINADLQLDAEELRQLSDTLARLEEKYGRHFFKCDHSLGVFAGERKNGGGCELGQKCLNIRPNGDVTGCPFLPIVVGNVRRETLIDIWRNSDALNRIRDEIRPEKLLGRCQRCPPDVKSVCRGGCKALAYEVSGSLMSPDPRCWRQ